MFQASAFCSDGAGELKAGWFGGRCHWRVGVAGHVTRRWSPPFLGLGTHGWWLCQRDAGSPYPFAGRAGRRWVTTKTDATCDGKMIVLVGEKLARSVARAVVGWDRCSLQTTPMLQRNSHVGRNVGSADDELMTAYGAAAARIDRDQMVRSLHSPRVLFFSHEGTGTARPRQGVGDGECPGRCRPQPRQDQG